MNVLEERRLGTITAGSSVTLDGATNAGSRKMSSRPRPRPESDLERTADELGVPARGARRAEAGRLGSRSDWRPGHPTGDRSPAGFVAILVHVRSGSPPSPDGRRYNLLAAGPSAASVRPSKAPSRRGPRCGYPCPGRRTRDGRAARGPGTR